MKKFLTLLWLTLAAFTFKAGAQTTTCNAAFTWQFINGSTVKFTPAVNDSPMVHHLWNFGDGSPISPVVSPIHSYLTNGSFVVVHTVIRHSPNNVPICTQSISHTIVIQQAPPVCTLVANFSWTVTQTNPLRIEFHNLSTPLSNTDSIRWTFGDGGSSNQMHPVHTYTVPGTYTVCLRIIKYNAGSTTPCVREICKTIIITQPCNLEVNFSSQPDPNHPLRIKFTNLSVPVIATDSVKWTFGDGASVSGVQGDPNVANPTHNYANAGAYTVCLTVKKHASTTNAPCIRYICRTIVVHEPCTLVVNFTSQADPNHALRIKFTNTSTPINASDSVRWTFGDGSSVSGLQSDPNVANPTHNYANAGLYRVCLRVKKNNNTTPVSCVREKCDSIIVHHPCNFDVNFRWHLDSINTRKVYFTNLSTPPTAGAIAVWTFGDGSSATSWNTIHEYAQPGRYIVCLRIYLGPNSNCVREKCDTIYIPQSVPPCTQLSKYHFERFPNDNQKYKFTADYINPNLQYTWTFGDGTGSHDPVAVHRYAQPGVYVVCLTVWRGPNCASTTCKEIRVQPQINCDTAHVSYTYQRNTQVPNKISFYANSSLPILDQTWTITKLGGTVATPPVILHQNNPVYVFQDTGYYKVCLRAILLGGCVKEYCNYIRIEHVSNACELQAYPNPTNNLINVNVTLLQPEMIHAFIYNNLNILVKEKHQQGVSGNNIVTMNVNDLPAGLYTIKLIYGNKVCYARFQKF